MVVIKKDRNISLEKLDLLRELDFKQINHFLESIAKVERSEQIKFLKKKRFILLEAIHEMQKNLDCIDYVIYLIKKNKYK
ncbi:hypothetical protein [Megamonas funiformis]|uniref:hypothetical protein n=1 Tax=Megamonas funiformis TaxID=437897 RepID=UPI0025F40CBE|nr:hypothetical protein [Megamonas funiformis]